MGKGAEHEEREQRPIQELPKLKKMASPVPALVSGLDSRNESQSAISLAGSQAGTATEHAQCKHRRVSLSRRLIEHCELSAWGVQRNRG